MIKVAYSDKYLYQLPEGHRFPISKYELVKDQLLYEGIIQNVQLFDPGKINKEILLAHSQDYYEKILNFRLTKSELRKLGVPLHQRSVGRALNSVAGTLKSANNALNDGLGINIGGGYHHAFYDHGEGFCIFNDLAVSARYLHQNHFADKILIIDLDVHQGNGTASILKNEPDIFTLSVHGKNNYPHKKEVSDLDVPVSDHINDKSYLSILGKVLSSVIGQFSPDFILYQSGVDVLESDKLGKLSLTIEGCLQRDKMVMELAKSLRVPLVITLGGGYSHKIKHIIKAHVNTIRIAIENLS